MKEALKLIRRFVKSPSIETFWAIAKFSSDEDTSEDFYSLICAKTTCSDCLLYSNHSSNGGTDMCEIIEHAEVDDAFIDYWDKHQGEIVIQFVRLLERLRSQTND